MGKFHANINRPSYQRGLYAIIWATLGLGLAVCLGGCQGGKRPIAEVDEGRIKKSVIEQYGQVDPRTLDENLTDEQLAKMFMELGEIPTEVLWEQAEPEPLVEAQGRDPCELCPVRGRKAYLRGRRLIKQGQLGEAKEEILAGLKADPNSAALYELLALAYFRSGNNRAAAQACRLALKADADRMSAYRILGLISLGRGDAGRAESLFRRGLQCSGADDANPQTALLRLRLAQTLMERDYLAAAVEQYQQAYRLLKRHSGYVLDNPILNRLVRQIHLPLLTQAGMQVSMGRIEQAVQSIRQAQGTLPMQLNLMRALIFYVAERRMALQARYQQVTALCGYLAATNYEVEDTLENYYQVCRKMAKHEDYLATLQQWYGAAPQEGKEPLLSGRQYAYGLSLAEMDDQAEKILQAELTRAPQEEAALVHRDLARLYGKRGQWREMILQYGTYLQMSEDQARAIISEAEDYTPRIEQLEEILKEGLQDERLQAEYGSCYLLGYLAQDMEKLDWAEEYYRRALTLNPQMKVGRRELVELLLGRGKYQEVLSWLGDSGTGSGAEGEMLWFAGRACAGLGKYQEATKYYQRVIEQDKDNHDAYLALGEILVRQGNYEKAEKILLEVLAQAPRKAQVYLRLLELYAWWGAKPGVDEQFCATARARSRLMLRRWLKSNEDQGKAQAYFEADRWSQAVAVLEAVRRRYGLDKNVVMMLGNLYSGKGRSAEAIEQVESLLQEYPEDVQLLKQAGRLYEKGGDLSQAGQLRLKVWQLNPDDIRALGSALYTMRRAGQAREAVDILWAADQQENGLGIEAIQLLQEEAYRLFAVSRQYQEAVKLFEKWYWRLWSAGDDVNGDSEKISPVLRAGENLIRALTEAQYYDRAILHVKGLYQRYKPENPWGGIYLSRSLNIRRLYKQSEDMLKDLLKVQPDNGALRGQLCLTMLEKGQAEAAQTLARAWLEEKPDDIEGRKLLLYLLRQTDNYEQAEEQLRQYLEENPQNETWRMELFNTLLMAGKYEGAQIVLSGLEEQIKDAPQWLDAHIRLDIARGNCAVALARIDDFTTGRRSTQIDLLKVQLQAACGQMDEAAELLKEVLDKEPENVDGRLRYTMYLERLGRQAEAIQLTEQLLEQFPDNAAIKNNLGYSLIESHQDIEQAYQLIQESLQSEPESAPTLDSMGWFYYKKGEFARGLEYIYQSAAGMAGPDPEVLDHLGDTMYRLDRSQEAEHYWQQARDELKRRVIIERYLASDLEKVIEKIRRLTAQEEVNVAGLFEED